VLCKRAALQAPVRALPDAFAGIPMANSPKKSTAQIKTALAR
jgi:hypothetical protein